MKKTITLFFAFFFSVATLAQTAVQRTTDSSYADYKKYLETSGGMSFSQAYIQLTSVTEMETPLLERCLEEMYLGAPAQSTCMDAVKSLGSKPLNQTRREVLFSFLSKMTKMKSQHREFYQKLRDGLLQTHPELAHMFHVAIPEMPEKATDLMNLEMKAWKSALAKKFPIDEVSLLINGKKVSKLDTWAAPTGVFQWSLISNTHEPFIRLGTFSQFAAESLKNLEPLAEGGCAGLENLEAQKFGLLKLEVFADRKCVAQFGMSTPVMAPATHLASSASMVKIDDSSSRHWVWLGLTVVGVGLAASMKGKNVQVQWPGSH